MMKAERIRVLEAELRETRRQRDDALDMVRNQDVVSAGAPYDGEKAHYPDEVRHAVIAVFLRLEERADKKTLPNGAALCVVESLYERAAGLRDLLGYEDAADQEHAEELLTELLGTSR